MNFFFSDHGIIFIHIPKNGGTSVRQVLETGKVSRAQGIVPGNWGNKPAFSVVRDPTDRFLSALNMFRLGTPDVEGHYSEARWPDLTPARALDILEDGAIPYDREERSLPGNLKHHMWPQTEPFFCLSRAGHILRFETFEDDFAAFLGAHGIEAEIPHMRRTVTNPERVRAEDLSREDLARLENFYARDFRELGYRPVTEIPQSPPLHISSDPLRAAWRVYFENITFSRLLSRDALPDPAVDLELFREARVPGKRGKTWAKRKRDLRKHFRSLEPEFGGQKRLLHLLACVIVSMRRDPENAAAEALFYRIVTEHGAELATEMNLRWLVSVCDTIVDTGATEADRAIALVGTMAAGAAKIADTERLMFGPFRGWPPKVRFTRGGSLYDGVVQFWSLQGDMINNLMDRSAAVLEAPSVAGPFVAEILRRLREEDTVFRRMNSLRGKEPPPLATERLKRAIAAAVAAESAGGPPGLVGRLRRWFGIGSE